MDASRTSFFHRVFPALPVLFGFSGLLPSPASALAAAAPEYRFAAPPTVARLAGGALQSLEWSAWVDCAAPPGPAAWIGARVVFTLDFDLDGAADAVDTLGVSPADCGEAEVGRIALRRRFSPAHPAVLRAVLQNPAGEVSTSPLASHGALTAGAGSLLAIARFCARPKNGEPEWMEIRNRSGFALPLARVRLETRALADSLRAGEALVAGSDTAELRLWQPGARLAALSSWPNLRNAGDTLRLSLATAGDPGAGLLLDSVIYAAGPDAREGCASLESEGSGAAAAGYALEMPSARWRRGAGDFVFEVRAPAEGRYDLRVYGTDGVELCALARNAAGPSAYRLPHPACARLQRRAGTFVLLLAPRAAPGVRTVIRITE